MKPELLSQFSSIVGANNTLTEHDKLDQYTRENRDLYVGKTPLVLKPASTQEVSEIVKLANATQTPLVPQGGHTGHVGGAVPDETGDQIVISLERMKQVREVDLEGNVLICEAGCVLESIQNLADENDRLFPLALGSQGSCQVGGNIATNAGGTGVLAYGNTRSLVMGLEVVLPNGDIWNGLRRLKKDNTGYDLKDLFIGAEGTLGIITAAVLKLFPKPLGKAVAFCGMESVKQAVALLGLAQKRAGSNLTAFEFMGRTPVSLTVKHMDGIRNPLSDLHDWHALLEVSSGRSQEDADATMQIILEEGFETGLIADATLAVNLSQQKEFWALRESMPLAQKPAGGSMKHDISIPVHRIAEFLVSADRIVMKEFPEARLYTFGHLGDGNIHYNITQPDGHDTTAFLAEQPRINELIHDLVTEFNGSVAAEHGVGLLKRDLIARSKDPVEMNMMRTIKAALDPNGLMNPGKVV